VSAAMSASISEIRGASDWRSFSPASVVETLRVVRASSRTPMRVSSRLTVWLSVDWVMPILAAAFVKLRSSATTRNHKRSLKFSRTPLFLA